MINVLLSGEGKTDIGEPNYSKPSQYHKGTMTCLVEMIIQHCTDETLEMELIHKSLLTQTAKKQKKSSCLVKKWAKPQVIFTKMVSSQNFMVVKF